MTLAGFIYVQVNALFPSDLLEMNLRADAISENLESSWNFFEFYLKLWRYCKLLQSWENDKWPNKKSLNSWKGVVFHVLFYMGSSDFFSFENNNSKKKVTIRSRTIPANIYLFKFNNKNTKKKVWNKPKVDSKNTRTTLLTLISIVLVFQLLTLNK